MLGCSSPKEHLCQLWEPQNRYAGSLVTKAPYCMLPQLGGLLGIKLCSNSLPFPRSVR